MMMMKAGDYVVVMLVIGAALTCGGTAVKGGEKDAVGVNALHIDEQFNAGDTARKANKLKCKNPTGKLNMFKMIGCQSKICRRSAGGAAWEECPQPATKQEVQTIKTLVENTATKQEVQNIKTSVDNTATKQEVQTIKILVENTATKQEVQSIKTRVDNTATKLEVRTGLSSLEENVGTKLKSIELILNDTATELSNVTVRVGKTATKQEVQSIKTRVDNTATKQELENIKTRVDNTSTKVLTIKTGVDNVGAQLESIGLILNKTATELSNVKGRVENTATKQEVQIIKTRVDNTATKQEVQTIKTRVDNTATKQEVQNIKTRVDNTATKQEVQTIKTQVDNTATKQDIQNIKTKVDNAATKQEVRSIQIIVDLILFELNILNGVQSTRCPGNTYGGCCTSATPCKYAEGDCDNDDECAGSLVCGLDNCKYFYPGVHGDFDCCVYQTSRLGTSDQRNGNESRNNFEDSDNEATDEASETEDGNQTNSIV